MLCRLVADIFNELQIFLEQLENWGFLNGSNDLETKRKVEQKCVTFGNYNKLCLLFIPKSIDMHQTRRAMKIKYMSNAVISEHVILYISLLTAFAATSNKEHNLHLDQNIHSENSKLK